MREAEIAWAAGIFEGEGTMCVRGNPGGLALVVTMKDEDVMRRFLQVVRYGKLAYQSSPSMQGNYRWVWASSTDHESTSIISMFWPFLGDRRRKQWVDIVSRLPERKRKRPARQQALFYRGEE